MSTEQTAEKTADQARTQARLVDAMTAALKEFKSDFEGWGYLIALAPTPAPGVVKDAIVATDMDAAQAAHVLKTLAGMMEDGERG